jgi:hypothetical protein
MNSNHFIRLQTTYNNSSNNGVPAMHVKNVLPTDWTGA